MATALDPDEVLRSSKGRDNVRRLARLFKSKGTVLLRQAFDIKCPPSNLPTILQNPDTKKLLEAAKLTKPQWYCLYPSPGMYGKSTDFDITLLFWLLRTICGLTPPATGWDGLPASTDHSFEADLARIKYYRNLVFCHVNENMEISDGEFSVFWREIIEALDRIAGQFSFAKETEWNKDSLREAQDIKDVQYFSLGLRDEAQDIQDQFNLGSQLNSSAGGQLVDFFLYIFYK